MLRLRHSGHRSGVWETLNSSCSDWQHNMPDLGAPTNRENPLTPNDRFHIQKLFYEAIDELRISYRRMARDLENDEIQRCREQHIEYVPFRHTNGDTRKQLLARAKHVLVKHFTKWTESQKIRAQIIFKFYPELKSVYDPALELTNIYNKHYHKDVARAKLACGIIKLRNWDMDASEQ